MFSIEEISEHILGGGVVAVPTDTVYGFFADASSVDAVNRVRKLKKKPIDSPIPIFVGIDEKLSKLAKNPAEVMLALERAFWPGPLLIVIEPSVIISNLPVCKDGKIGLRKSDSSIVNQLIVLTRKYLTATSANRYNERPALDEDKVKSVFGNSDLIIVKRPEGHRALNIPSTAVTMDGDRLVVLREGVISVDRMNSMLLSEGYSQQIENVR